MLLRNTGNELPVPPAGGPDFKMGTLGGMQNSIFIIGKVLGGTALLEFVSRYPFGMAPKHISSGFAWPSVATNSTTTIGPTTTSGPPALPPGYHYQYKADVPVTTKRKADNVQFVKKHASCPDEGTNHGNAEILEYVPKVKLRVGVWGYEFTLDPATPATLPGLTGCGKM